MLGAGFYRLKRDERDLCDEHREVFALNLKENVMNKDQVKGVGEQVKGKINEVVGKATDDPAQEAKGDMQQVAGKIQKGAGDVREDLKDSVRKNP